MRATHESALCHAAKAIQRDVSDHPGTAAIAGENVQIGTVPGQALGQPAQAAPSWIGATHPIVGHLHAHAAGAADCAQPDPGWAGVLQRVSERLGRGEPGGDGDVAGHVAVNAHVRLSSGRNGEVEQCRSQTVGAESPGELARDDPRQFLLRRLPGRARRNQIFLRRIRGDGQCLIEQDQALRQRADRAVGNVACKLAPDRVLDRKSVV